jgi:hypothetical protein
MSPPDIGHSVLPTDRVIELMRACDGWVAALIAIGSDFVRTDEDEVYCTFCDAPVWTTCAPRCPGLRARRALGVA